MNIVPSLSEEQARVSANHTPIQVSGFFFPIRDRIYNGDSRNPMYEYPPSGYSKVILHSTFNENGVPGNVYEQLRAFAYAHFPNTDTATIQQSHVGGCAGHGTQPAISFVTTDHDIEAAPFIKPKTIHSGHGMFHEGTDESSNTVQAYIKTEYPGP